MKPSPTLFGLLAEFDSAQTLVEAARETRNGGYARIDALAPFDVPGLDEALRLTPTRMPLIFLTGGILGGLGGFLMQVYAAVFSYPLNVGGRPLYSWPAFIPITFEMTILGAGLAGAFGMLVRNGLPCLHHPLFNIDRFELASQSRFFLYIEAEDSQFELVATRAFLQSLHALNVYEVPR